jgi:hypothetical protein
MKQSLRTSFIIAIAVLVMVAGVALSTRTAEAAPTNQLSIDYQAQLVSMNVIDVQVEHKCYGGLGGSLVVQVQQTSNGITQNSATTVGVNCDGHPSRATVELIGPNPWSLGPATAQATLFLPWNPSGNATDMRTINIVQ